MRTSKEAYKENSWLDPFTGLAASKAKLQLACPGRTRSAMQARPKMSFPLKVGGLSSISRNFKLQPIKALRDLPLSLVKNLSSPNASLHQSPKTPNFSVDKSRKLKNSLQIRQIARPSHSAMRHV